MASAPAMFMAAIPPLASVRSKAVSVTVKSPNRSVDSGEPARPSMWSRPLMPPGPLCRLSRSTFGPPETARPTLTPSRSSTVSTLLPRAPLTWEVTHSKAASVISPAAVMVMAGSERPCDGRQLLADLVELVGGFSHVVADGGQEGGEGAEELAARGERR